MKRSTKRKSIRWKRATGKRISLKRWSSRRCGGEYGEQVEYADEEV